MTTRHSSNVPRPGDVVVARAAPPAQTYLLHVFRGATQLLFYSREEAIFDATTFAEIHQVDVWFTADGEHYERAGGYRRERRPA